jgi:hypothetical protein
VTWFATGAIIVTDVAMKTHAAPPSRRAQVFFDASAFNLATGYFLPTAVTSRVVSLTRSALLSAVVEKHLLRLEPRHAVVVCRWMPACVGLGVITYLSPHIAAGVNWAFDRSVRPGLDLVFHA